MRAGAIIGGDVLDIFLQGVEQLDKAEKVSGAGANGFIHKVVRSMMYFKFFPATIIRKYFGWSL